MATRIRTIDFLPEIFKTQTNSQFLGATLDQLVQQPNISKVQGYIGSKFGYGVNANDKYVAEPTKIRQDYQLDPSVVFLKKDTDIAQDFITYPGIVDGIGLEGGITNKQDRLFKSEFYSWDSFTDLDKLINYNEYYWLAEGPPAVQISTETVYNTADYVVEKTPNGYQFYSEGLPVGGINPSLVLLRGGTYTFSVNQTSNFWIQGTPGVTGRDPLKPNVNTRDVLGVERNGATTGVVSFTVPYANAQDEWNYPGNNLVDLVTTKSFDEINGQLLSTVGNIDGVTALAGRTVMFYGASPSDTGYISAFYDETLYDQDDPALPDNFGAYEGGFNSQLTASFYLITYIGDLANPTLRLTEYSSIPNDQRITAQYGTTYVGLNFVRTDEGVIIQYPYLSAILDTLYYQDGTSANTVGQLKLIADTNTNSINVLTEVIGKKNYTSPNGVVFTNGLKVFFTGDIFPSSYENVIFYVQGVGTAIELIREDQLITPESFSGATYTPYDTTPYDIGNYDSTLYVPATPDYITIARNSLDLNAWTRSNRWFHIGVINATATYNNNPAIVTQLATQSNKAVRPIIEFYPNLKLFNAGIVGRPLIDYINFTITDAFSQVAGQEVFYPDTEVYTTYSITLPTVTSATSATITVPVSAVTSPGSFRVGQYINDSANIIPPNAQITAITGITTLSITIEWVGAKSFSTISNVSLIANDTSNSGYALFDGATIIFANDENINVRTKVYTARFATLAGSPTPVITLTESPIGQMFPNEQTTTLKGYNYVGETFWLDGTVWEQGQQKTSVNQAPYFDIVDENDVSFGDSTVYNSTSFTGTTLFAYGIGAGAQDNILGFPIRYSGVSNLGDISFDVTLNGDTFDYVRASNPITQKVNTGYVLNYSDLTTNVKQLGWQTAVAPSVQYQIFDFKYIGTYESQLFPKPWDVIYSLFPEQTQFVCDIPALTTAETVWPSVQVYVNNVLQTSDKYTVAVEENSTTISLTMPDPLIDNSVQILLLSTVASDQGYYQVPINLSNNPFNQDVTTVNVGDIRGHYQSIFYNAPNTAGEVFGANNYRDLGDLVPYGNRIIQNSASLVLPSVFLRKANHNLFNALLFNSREYTKFKQLLVDTVNKGDYSIYDTPATILDDALDIIGSSKSESSPFFWSDMVPSKSPFASNTYTFANSLDVSIYPLSKIYDFNKANYNGVLVYLSQTVDGFTTTTQLIINVDYTISETSPSLTITQDLSPGDVITINQYNQTYGSFVPNTPSKMGLYESFIPAVVLDTSYLTPTYFILGHDGSYTKLYGDYIDGQLVDFRDKALLEYETRIYNNIKVSNAIPIPYTDVIPGFYRNTDYSYEETLEIYSEGFLNWAGENRIDYKAQYFQSNNQFTWNYNQCSNKIDNTVMLQGYWRGIYRYFYDTDTPDSTPWAMLGYANQPTWWETRYGPAPYTSDNLVLWEDLAQGVSYNNGDPVVLPAFVRPTLVQEIPVDSAGNLVSPFVSVIGNYNSQSYNRPWRVGDGAPAEASYLKSSTWPFDLMKLLAVTQPADFFNLSVDVDNYKYSSEFGQYLVNNRSHLNISDIEIYGNGIAKNSYINWIVDFEKQFGIDATSNITELLDNLDVRLAYRVAGYTGKDMMKFYVEKASANSNNSSLLIPDESYAVLLYDNQPYDKIIYSSVIIQSVPDGFKVYGNSQTKAYFRTATPKINGNYTNITVSNLNVKVAVDYSPQVTYIPYGTLFTDVQTLSQFLMSYGKYLNDQGVQFQLIEEGIQVDWDQMCRQFLYWAQTGWEVGSTININPVASVIQIDKESTVVQPLTLQQQNFLLNQDLYPLQPTDISVVREGTIFTATALNQGDSISYGQFNMSNFEHGIVFNNTTLFNDTIYNLITGLRQNRIQVRGAKTAEWNGTVDAQGFILNQDNVQEWSAIVKYTKGSIVKFKNKYWVASRIIQPSTVFEEQDWVKTEYSEIQTGLLPNPSTNSYEMTLYYDSNRANLEKDADLLSFSLIGYRPRDYLEIANLTDITQINVYKNLIKGKGTDGTLKAFNGSALAQGTINYDLYENWAIKTSEYGGVLNQNYVDFRLSETALTGNPSIVGLTNGQFTEGVQQEVPLYSLYNYGRYISSPNILRTVPDDLTISKLPNAGYVNFNDVKVYSFTNIGLNTATRGAIATPIQDLYLGNYVWLASHRGTWNVYTPVAIDQVATATNNFNGTTTLTFCCPHNLSKYDLIGVVNFDSRVNGYYTVMTIVDPFNVSVSLTLDASVTSIQAQGIGFKLVSQRVDQPSDISTLPLLNTEFVKNKAWVDTNSSGEWGVYRKSINYTYGNDITKAGSDTFGSAVAYGQNLGFLIGDAEAGKVYRYTYNVFTKQYDLSTTITQTTGFGSAITVQGNTVIISDADSNVYVYLLTVNNQVDELTLEQTITAPGTVSSTWASAIALSGDSNWLYISDTIDNEVYVYKYSSVTSLYELVVTLDEGFISDEQFGYSLTTDYNGDTLIVGVPDADYSVSIDKSGFSYVYNRTVQRFEAQYTSFPEVPQVFTLAWTPTALTTRSATGTAVTTNLITLASASGLATDDAVTFSGAVFGNISINTVYYITSIVGSTITVSLERGGDDVVLTTASGTMTLSLQDTPLDVNVNGTTIDDSQYFISGSTINIIASLTAGDIVTVSGSNFALSQVLTSETTPRIGAQFGQSVATNTYANELLVGAPFEINSNGQEGSVFRYTNGGKKYGQIIGTNNTTVVSPVTILLNGYSVTIPIGSATTAANAINSANITNVQATASNNKLIIGLINTVLSTPNDKLVLTVLSDTDLSQLGLVEYTQTQIIVDPHIEGTCQFGNNIAINEDNSFIVSAPTGTRFVATTFDFTDDENLDNDTIFDNNFTRWVDSFPNAGAVYMFDYLPAYNESLNNAGEYVYAQSVNDLNSDYGSQPMYGYALAFSENKAIIGTPGFTPSNGNVVWYDNPTGVPDWSIYRSPLPAVNTDSIQTVQLYSAQTNQTLGWLDYIDPLQGKLLGSVRQNIDIISNRDPAGYNSNGITTGNLLWGADQIGKIWLDTTSVRFVDYHQPDIVYNSRYWGTIFPGSEVAVYSWLASSVTPDLYQGPGTPYDITTYATDYTINATGALVAVYYFWVKNSNIIFEQLGKTLSDTILEQYIANPLSSGISYMAPLMSNIFALYNCAQDINNNDTVMHIGFSTGTGNDVDHNLYSLIRSNYADDFLPGLPSTQTDIDYPQSLYERMLDSLAGVNLGGGVVPDPFLPKPVQTGILTRPSQSFFYDRFLALKNYLTYANTVLAQYPIAEFRTPTYLSSFGDDYDTRLYWTYVNWWATGYNNTTKSAIQVDQYYQLETIPNPTAGLIVTVVTNSDGKKETYIYTILGQWDRIGLERGTIEFSSKLWDYNEGKFGFDSNFWDTTPYDEYPSTETRFIIRALNEQIYTNELLIHRNKSLILLFEYIQSETIESQNYLPWLNKTSLVDVSHTLRELIPYKVFQTDNQPFLEGYINEAKPYHVVIKEFVFKYTGEDVYEGDITDFDLPASYDSVNEQFITPELVYSFPNGDNQFLPTSSVWQESQYSQWYNNYGLSVSGERNYPICTLTSYIDNTTRNFTVDNAYGLPINGTMLIGTELIGYSTIDRDLGIISGLTRGVNNTTLAPHIPGTTIIMDLPAALLLYGGRGYTLTPRVTAYIDTSIYPEPRRAAVFQANMSLDSVLSITCTDSGDGYAVLPEIIIDPAVVVLFGSSNINLETNTVALSNLLLQTGDLIRYTVGTGSAQINGLINNEWYYIRMVDETTNEIAFYTDLPGAQRDHDRVQIYSVGDGTNYKLSLGAKASCVTNALPIRENIIQMRFDRTTYNSRIVDWAPGGFYGSFYTGLYNNSQRIASSSILLYSEYPPINNILASAQGAPFEVLAVSDDETITWNVRTRNVLSTSAVIANSIVLSEYSTDVDGFGTTGFYVGMPVKFTGQSFGGITVDATYYVHSILDDVTFKISATFGGSVFTLSSATPGGSPFICQPGNVTDVTVLTIDYPDIQQATGTTAITNVVYVPMTTDTSGTTDFYLKMPVMFTGNVFGGVVENEDYFVTTIIDNEHFTMSPNSNLTITDVTATTTGTNLITVTSTVGFKVNDPIIFSGTTFGNVVAGTTYYVSSVYNNTQLIISAVINGGPFAVNTASGSCTVTNQKDTVTLTTATGSMTCTSGAPISPGQINGQAFTMYGTSSEYPGLTGTNGALIERTIVSALADVDYLAITTSSGGLTNVYENLPIRFASSFGGLSTGTTYYVVDTGTVQTDVTSTTSGNVLICDSTAGFYNNMPVIFSDATIGGVELNTPYYVIGASITSTQFKISATVSGSEVDLLGDSGSMTATGTPYIQVSATLGGSVFGLTNASGTVTMTQYVTSVPEFDVSWILGGYRADITVAGSGYAIDNTITIAGNLLGGTTPANDLVMKVNGIDTEGELTSVICNGTPSGTNSKYYFKVITSDTVGVYYDSLMLQPVAYSDFNYVAGSYALLPEPFYFDQSIVKYNNKLYECIVSNNDTNFVIGKWKLMSSDSRKLNALDRIIGYYQPTANMPGVDLTQLVKGITYPNSTYKGNLFSPEDEYTLDTLLTDQPFYPTDVDVKSILWDGVKYVAASNTNEYSAALLSADADTWAIEKLSNIPIGVTDVTYGGDYYVMTTTNAATPLIISPNGITWVTSGEYTPYDSAPYDTVNYDVTALNVPSNLLNSATYNNGLYIAVGENIISSTDAIDWTERYRNPTTLYNIFNSVTYANTTAYSGFIAVGGTQQIISGEGTSSPEIANRALIVTSINGITWTILNSYISDYYFNGITSSDSLIVAVGDNSVIFTSTNSSNWVEQYVGSGSDPALNDVIWGNSLFVAVGDNGTILTSANGSTWTTRTSGVTENLNGIVWNNDSGEFVAVGENGTIITSSNGTTWSGTPLFETTPTIYDVQGGEFLSGYGPEELVPGIVSDTLSMTVVTRPGTNWPATTDGPIIGYGHVGYNTVSTIITPTATSQVEYSFNNLVDNLVQLDVYAVNMTSPNGLGTRLYEGIDYTITDWIGRTLTLTNPLSTLYSLRIDAWEVGNGDQLVKSNSLVDPIRFNNTLGTSEIYLDCNYTGTITQGSGVYQPGSTTLWAEPVVYHNGTPLVYGIITDVTSTEAGTNFIVCTTTSGMNVDDPVIFTDTTFGNIDHGVTYYILQVVDGSRFTVSTSLGGLVMDQVTASGGMKCVTNDYAIAEIPNSIKAKIVFAETYNDAAKTLASATTDTTNIITVLDTTGFTVDQEVIFTGETFGGIAAGRIYYVNSVVSSTEFTIKPSVTSPILVLTTSTGEMTVTVDGPDHDYVAYSIFGETLGVQYEFTLPEVQLITADGTVGPFTLDNYVGGDNPENAIVEVNGLRVDPSTYTIDDTTNTLTFSSGTPSSGDNIAVTTYNSTERQSFDTETFTGQTVANIVFVSNTTPVVITTGINHGLATNDIVRIDGLLGSTQLNNNAYYVNVLNSTQVELYNDSAFAFPVNGTLVGSWTGNGWMWLDEIFTLAQPQQQINTDRLWVTVNGERINSSGLYVNANNNLSILSTIESGDDIIVTSMTPTATPNETTYINQVDKNGTPTVYRANSDTYTWLTQDLQLTDTEIHIYDITKVVDVSVQTTTVSDTFTVGSLTAGVVGKTKDITSVVVYNNTTGLLVPSSNYSVRVVDLASVIYFTNGVSNGDEIILTVSFGNIISINGEKIGFTGVDYVNGILTGIQRGIAGTGAQALHPRYATVYSYIPTNMLPDVYYDLTWNSNTYNVTLGDPLQVSTTNAANFLNDSIN